MTTPTTPATEILESIGLDPAYIAREVANSRRATGTRSAWDIGDLLSVESPREAQRLVIDLEAQALELAHKVAQRLADADTLRTAIADAHGVADDIDDIDDVAGLVHYLRQRRLTLDDSAQGKRDGYVIDATTAIAYASCCSLRADDAPWGEVELTRPFTGDDMGSRNSNWATTAPAPTLADLIRDAWETGHTLKARDIIGVELEDLPGDLVGIVTPSQSHVSVLDVAELASVGSLHADDDVRPILVSDDDIDDIDMLRAYLSCMGEWDDDSAHKARDNYAGEYDSGADLVEALQDDGALEEVPNWAARYIDYDAAWECDLRHDYSEAHGHYWLAH